MDEDLKNPGRNARAAGPYSGELSRRLDSLQRGRQENREPFVSRARDTPLIRASGQCEVTGQLETCISASLESLDLAVTLYRIDPRVVASAHYAVIRTAVETSSTGIWLGMTGGENRIRFKSLKLAYRDNENIIEAAQRMSGNAHRLLSNRKAKQKRLKEQFPTLECAQGRNIETFSDYSQIIHEADTRMRGKMERRLLDGEMSWRLCSGSAHGSRDLLTGLGITSPTGHGDESTEEIVLQRGPWNTINCMFPALENCERQIVLYRSGAWD